MFKLFVLATILAVASAAPGLLRSGCIGCGLVRSDFVSRPYFAEPLVRTYGTPLISRYETPLIKSAVIGEVNGLKTFARSAGGETLATFDSKPAIIGERLAYAGW